MYSEELDAESEEHMSTVSDVWDTLPNVSNADSMYCPQTFGIENERPMHVASDRYEFSHTYWCGVGTFETVSDAITNSGEEVPSHEKRFRDHLFARPRLDIR